MEVCSTIDGFLVFVFSLSLLSDKVDDLEFFFELLALMRIFVIGTTSTSIGEGDIE